MRPIVRCWLLSSILMIVLASACKESGYCSIGISKQWVGDIRESKQLHSFLASVPFKKEIIISAVLYNGPRDPYGDLLLQLHGDLMKLGIAHFSFVTNQQSDCEYLANETLTGPISCVYDSGEIKNLPEWVVAVHLRVWFQRIRFIARTIRLGFNVMLVDADTMFFSDPYVSLKRPPLNEVQFLCNPEGGGTFNCNGGFDYIHDVAPDGPVAWVWFDIIRTALSRADDHFEFTKKWTGNNDNCNNFDQALIGDSLVTAGVGRPLYYNHVMACKRPRDNPEEAHFVARNGQRLTTNQVVENMMSLMAYRGRGKFYPGTPNKEWLDQLGWLPEIPAIDAEMWSVNITIPNMNYGYPEELGGRIFPDTPSGIYSNTWIETLKNDCPSCPWFNDKRPLIGEDPLYQLFPSGDYSKLQRPANESQLNLFIDPAIKKESFGNMPHWFASSLFSHRRGMSLGPAATMRNSYLSIGHIHNWFGQSDRKMSFRKFYGAYNFSLGSILAARRNETPYERATHFDRVLVLDPKIDLSRLRDWNEFSSMIMGLKQLARLSHRVLVMPEVPCVAQWLHEKQWLQKYKSICMAPTFFQDHGFQILSVIYPVDKESGELVGGWSRRRMAEEAKDTNFLKPEVQAWWSSQKYMAQVVAAVSPACTHRHAITTPDFHHWLRNSEPGKRASSKPSDSNSAFRVDPSQQDLMLKPPVEVDKAPIGLGGTVEPLPDNGWSWYDRQSAVSARDAIREMFCLRAEPVVFLSHPVMLVPGEGGEEIGVDIDTGVTRKVQDPNSLLHTINEMITLGLPNCRAIRPTFHHKEQEGTVDLNHGIPSTISSSGMLVKRP